MSLFVFQYLEKVYHSLRLPQDNYTLGQAIIDSRSCIFYYR